MSLPTRARLLTVSSILSIAAFARPAAADTVVQVPVDSVIDGRTVSTVANNVITPWTATDGVDGDGNADGFVTNAVEAILNTMGKTEGGKVGVALPDDGLFAAMPPRLPAIQLHFSNATPITSPQTHQLHQAMGPQTFMFDVPSATYSKMFLLITTSEGSAKLTVTLNYAGGTAAQVMMYTLPDYGIGGAAANDPVYFNLIMGMHKWGTSDQEGDTPSHTITGIEINPTPTGMLTSIEVAKTNAAHVVFWGATGIATSAVTTGAGGSTGTTDAGAGGATGTDGGAGASGAAGAAGGAGTGGTTGAAGSTTGAAGSMTRRRRLDDRRRRLDDGRGRLDHGRRRLDRRRRHDRRHGRRGLDDGRHALVRRRLRRRRPVVALRRRRPPAGRRRARAAQATPRVARGRPNVAARSRPRHRSVNDVNPRRQ